MLNEFGIHSRLESCEQSRVEPEIVYSTSNDLGINDNRLFFIQVLLGEVDTQNDVESRGLERIGLEEILEKQSLQQAEKEEKERQLSKAFKEHGLIYAPETTDDAY